VIVAGIGEVADELKDFLTVRKRTRGSLTKLSKRDQEDRAIELREWRRQMHHSQVPVRMIADCVNGQFQAGNAVLRQLIEALDLDGYRQ